MKPVVIIAIAFVLLVAVPITVYGQSQIYFSENKQG